jgi:hypothetical protein
MVIFLDHVFLIMSNSKEEGCNSSNDEDSMYNSSSFIMQPTPLCLLTMREAWEAKVDSQAIEFGRAHEKAESQAMHLTELIMICSPLPCFAAC